ncbi:MULTISPECIES: hypothetical protein [unclassified Actinobaculum]|uniref:hypothetical protein n=1 Tax=unclassified Actinobaculum TaxID=2609299 RepID=UPI000D52A312|nr:MULTISPECIES: hypothetical protein [unclassified Actinobaculum]AWE41911.1 hypothetical protein DDD63_03115 [Actinobaculum sp. 313]RTE50174.1 hypothetical protein EKN07_02845 [Actinobaculum sp. 352]
MKAARPKFAYPLGLLGAAALVVSATSCASQPGTSSTATHLSPAATVMPPDATTSPQATTLDPTSAQASAAASDVPLDTLLTINTPEGYEDAGSDEATRAYMKGGSLAATVTTDVDLLGSTPEEIARSYIASFSRDASSLIELGSGDLQGVPGTTFSFCSVEENSSNMCIRGIMVTRNDVNVLAAMLSYSDSGAPPEITDAELAEFYNTINWI